MKKAVFVLTFVCLLFMSGCCVTKEVETQVKEGAVIGDDRVEKWADLTPEQREKAHWKMVRILHDLNYALFETPIPDAYKSEFKPTVDKDGKPLKKDDLLDDAKKDGGK